MSLANRFDEGFSITITFGDFPSIEFYEKDVQPPGYSMGGPIRTTTQRNTTYETKAPKSLLEVLDNSTRVAYTSDAFHQSTGVKPMMGKRQLITYNLPDGATIAVYGYVDEFVPEPFTIGEQPEASVKIVHTMTHPTTKVETAPVFTPRP